MKKIQKILCPVGLWDEATEGVFEYAAEVARKFDAEVLLLYVSPIFPEIVELGDFVIEGRETLLQVMEKEAQERIQKLAKNPVFEGVKINTSVLRGEPVDEILRFAETQPMDMIIMGTHGRRGMDRFFFGSVAEKVVRTSSVPVLTIRPRE